MEVTGKFDGATFGAQRHLGNLQGLVVRLHGQGEGGPLQGCPSARTL